MKKELAKIMDMAGLLGDIRKVYGMLEDEESRFVYINRLNYLLTGEMQYIERITARCLPGVPVYDRRGLGHLFHRLPVDRQVVLYGVGQDAEVVFPYLERVCSVFGFCDRDSEKYALGFRGYSVISPDELLCMEDISIIICSRRYGNEIRKYLFANGVEEKFIFDIREYLPTCSENEYFENFLGYSNDEVFIDAGCKDLSTTVRFAGLCPGLRKVYAFEPDPANYKKCWERREKESGRLPETVLFPHGIWSGRTKLGFDASADGSSHISADGLTVIDTVSIDEAVGREDIVTFIKMDIEGAELEALKGAQTVIRRDKPKCAVCIYHKMEDMITIPLYMKELVPEYKLYVRHYSNSDSETVLYAVI